MDKGRQGFVRVLGIDTLFSVSCDEVALGSRRDFMDWALQLFHNMMDLSCGLCTPNYGRVTLRKA